MLLKSSLPGTTRHVLLTLSCHVNDAGEACHPSVAQLCEETALSKRVVCLHLKAAAEAGWIVVAKHGFGGQKWARNEYRLAWPDDEKRAELSGAKNAESVSEGGDFNDTKNAEGGYFNDIKVGTQSTHLRADHIYGFPSSIPNNPLTPLTADAVDACPMFGEFWRLLPAHRHIAKAKCLRMWLRKGLEARGERVIAALKADLASEQWRKQGGEFVPHPFTWLNQDRFERDLSAKAQRLCSVPGCSEAAKFAMGHRELCAAHFRADEQ